MDAIEAILTRRSIRKYKQKEAPDGVIEKIVEAGMHAPSAGNEQPWRFIVVNDKKILGEVSKLGSFISMAKDASFVVLVCCDLNFVRNRELTFWVEDCSAAVQNMLLSAHALGLGSVWTGVYPAKERVDIYRKMFKLPENIIPFAMLPFGYPAENPGKAGRFKKDRIHYNGI